MQTLYIVFTLCGMTHFTAPLDEFIRPEYQEFNDQLRYEFELYNLKQSLKDRRLVFSVDEYLNVKCS